MTRLCSQEELRQLGGLDHLVHTMSDCLNYLTADEISIWTEPLHNKLKKVEYRLKKNRKASCLDNRCNDFHIHHALSNYIFVWNRRAGLELMLGFFIMYLIFSLCCE